MSEVPLHIQVVSEVAENVFLLVSEMCKVRMLQVPCPSEEQAP